MSHGDETAFQMEADRLLGQALELPSAERAAFLGEACAGRPDLYRLVTQLAALAGTDSGDPWLDIGPDGAENRLDAAHEFFLGEIGERHFGPYRLLRELGRGGMGVVFLAERADGQFDRQVALKLLHYGAGHRATERFHRERRILAALDDRRIARLLDGGVSDGGLPFLVMEYVDGRPLDTYCDDHDLGLQERLELFMQVCRAVGAAHRRLVIHRDLKPSNIFVTEDGEVKLLDFGIAKLLDPGEDDGLPDDPTRAMTPSYASPEQFRGEAITVASDIYQLGLLLYRLLTGYLPYDVSRAGTAEAEKLICEQAVIKPSLAETPGEPGRHPAGRHPAGRHPAGQRTAWSRSLVGDLDTIVGKALAKEPEARYASAEALIEDLERRRDGLPINARPPSLGYVVGKLVRRHRGAMALSTVVLASFLALIVGYTAQLATERDRAEAARAAAEKAREEAEAVSRSLADLFALADPERGPNDAVDAIDLLRKSAEKVRHELADLPLARSRFLHTLGEIYTKLDRLDDAESLIREALEIRQSVLTPDHPAVIESVNQLGVVLGRLRPDGEAEALLQRALAARRRAGETEPVALVLNNLGNLEWRRGNMRAAESFHREALGLRRTEAPPDPLRIGDSANNLGVLLQAQGRLDDALPFLQEAAEHYSKSYGADHPSTAVAFNNLGIVLQSLGRYAAAEGHFRRVSEAWDAAYGPSHSRTLRARHNLGQALFRQGQLDEADQLLDELLQILEEIDPSEPRDIERARNLNFKGLVRAHQGRFADARRLLSEALDIRRRLFPLGNARLLFVELNLLETARLEGRWDLAEQIADQLSEQYEPLLAEQNRERARLDFERGLIAAAQGRIPEARSALSSAFEIRTSILPPDHPYVEEARSALDRLPPAPEAVPHTTSPSS